nr:DCC1-like thiol-disulfide oxidoreductase family protein [Fulvimarina endophytica]
MLRRLDRRDAIRFVDADEAGAEGCPLDRSQLLARFHACEDGKLLHGGAAFAAVWRAIPVLRPLGLAFRGPFASALLERCYLLFLRVRPALQRLMHRLERS